MRTRIIANPFLFWFITLLVCAAATLGAVSAQGEVLPTPAATEDPAAESLVETAQGAADAITGTAANLWDQIVQTPQSDIARVVLLIGGIILLVAGWLVYEWIILIAGFFIGGAVALGLVDNPDALVAFVAFLIGGVIGAALGALLYYIAVFLIGGYVGIAITQAIAAALSLTPVSLIAVIVGFVVGGIVLVFLSMELLIIFSAIVGAQLIALALDLGVEWVLLIALVGIVIQFVAARARGVNFRRPPARRALWVRR